MKFNFKLIVMFLFSVLAVAACTGCIPKKLPYFDRTTSEVDKYSTDEAKKLIREIQEFREIDKVCAELPRPEDSVLVAMKAFKQPNAISYFYSSSVPYDSMEQEFRKYFLNGNWKQTNRVAVSRLDEFTKGNFRIAIQFGNVGNANYSIHCEQN